MSPGMTPNNILASEVNLSFFFFILKPFWILWVQGMTPNNILESEVNLSFFFFHFKTILNIMSPGYDTKQYFREWSQSFLFFLQVAKYQIRDCCYQRFLCIHKGTDY